MNISGIRLPKYKENIEYNYSYFPIYVNKNQYGLTRDELFTKFRNNNILVRKYFYPLLDNSDNLVNAKLLADSVLCLPIYPDLINPENIIKVICEF